MNRSRIFLLCMLFSSLASSSLCSRAYGQNQANQPALSADETLSYLQQKLQTYGVARWYNGLQCEGPQQTIDISSDRRFIIYAMTEDRQAGSRQGHCLRTSHKIPVSELEIGGERGGYSDITDATSAAHAHKLETGDWAENSYDGYTAVFFACKYRECVRASGLANGTYNSAWLELYDIPEEQVTRISRAMAHLVDVLQKEPANARDKNDPFAR